MNLDASNLTVLSELRKNCRATYRDLGDKLGMNLNTVANRIKSLERDGYILGYYTHIDYEQIGFTSNAILRIKLDSAYSLNKTDLNDVISMPECIVAVGTTGVYNLSMMVKTRNFNELLDSMSKIGKNKHVMSLTSELITKHYKEYEDFNPLSSTMNHVPTKIKIKKPVDELDLAILRELRPGANKPLRELSDKLKTPISTVKERTDRMERNGIIKAWVADVNFPKLGYWSFGSIRIKLETNRFNDEEIVRKLLEIPELATLAIVMGEHDLITGVLAKSGDHATEILKTISNINGVHKCEYEVVLSVLKSALEFNPLSNFKMSEVKS